jgi:hypothetical protein
MLTDGSSMAIGHIVRDMIGMKMPAVWGDVDYPETGINIVPPDDEATGTLALTGMAGNRLFEMEMELKRVGEDKLRKVAWKEGDLLIVEADEVHYPSSKVVGTRFLQFKVSGYFRGTGIPGGGMGGG